MFEWSVCIIGGSCLYNYEGAAARMSYLIHLGVVAIVVALQPKPISKGCNGYTTSLRQVYTEIPQR